MLNQITGYFKNHAPFSNFIIKFFINTRPEDIFLSEKWAGKERIERKKAIQVSVCSLPIVLIIEIYCLLWRRN